MEAPIKFQVMGFNLRFGLAEDGENSWEHRRHIVSRLLEVHTPTFIGLQESNHFQTRFLIERLPGYRYVGWHNKENERWQSNLIFYDAGWTCVRHRHFFLSHTPDTESRLEGSKWPRQCVIGLFEKDGVQLIMANTHFDFDAEVQKESASLVCKFLSGFPAGKPVVITGDFNSDPGSPAHRLFKDAGFKDAFDGQYATTFHVFEGKETGRHIDWILYRGPFVLSDAQIIRDNDAGRYPSDHYPVAAGFDIRT